MTPRRTPLASGAPNTPSEVMVTWRVAEDVKVPALGAVPVTEKPALMLVVMPFSTRVPVKSP